MARQFLKLVTESAYKVATASPVLNVDTIPIRISDDNAYPVRPAPQVWTIRAADGRNRRVQAGSERTTITGRLQTRLYYTQAPLLLKWALQPINAGQTVPWVTTEPPFDLASMTAYHGIEADDGSIKRRKYRGGKVAGGELTGDNAADLMSLSLDLNFSDVVGDPAATPATADPDATEFPEPALGDYATDRVAFRECAGLLKVGSTRSNFSRFRLAWRNTLDPRHDEFRYVASCRLCGRDVDFEATLLLKSAPDDRTPFEAVTPADSEVSFTNGVHTIKFDFGGNNFRTAVGDNTPLGKRFDYGLTLGNFLDPAIGEDMVLSFAGYP